MRASVRLILTCVSLQAASCLPGMGATRGPDKARLTESTCRSVRVPGNPSLASAEPAVRQQLARLAERGPVAVRYERDGCAARFEIVEDCVLAGRYSYRAVGGGPETIKVRDDKQLLEALPIGAPRLSEVLSKNGAIALNRHVVGQMAIPAGKAIKRDSMSEPCARATHLVTRIEIGRFWLAAGTDQALSKVEGPPPSGENSGGKPDAKSGEKPGEKSASGSGVEWLDHAGDIDACRKASKTRQRSERCGVPLSATLVSIGAFHAAEEPQPGDMLTIPAGKFTRGRAAGAADQGPPRSIYLDAFQIDRTEVTAAAYDACVAHGACKAAGEGEFCTSGALGKEQHPINCIDWTQAQAFCKFAGKRLPTEAEWERAARGSDDRVYEWGNDWPPPANGGNLADAAARRARPHWRVVDGFNDGYAGTAPVDELGSDDRPRQVGGNVAEWVADYYDAKFYGKGPAKNPKGPTKGSARVLRGPAFGTWKRAEVQLTYRRVQQPDRASIHFGVRCAKDVEVEAPRARGADAELPAGEAPAK